MVKVPLSVFFIRTSKNASLLSCSSSLVNLMFLVVLLIVCRMSSVLSLMQDLESKAVTNNDDIKTWDRYVDDVLATVKKYKTDDILQTINNTTKNIKFTKEEEQDNKLAFLDVLITKTDNGTLTTQVYRKKTHTDQILNYNSNHPTQHKVSCIKTQFNRIDTHCNTDQSKQDERKYLYSTFYKNDYPLRRISSPRTKLLAARCE